MGFFEYWIQVLKFIIQSCLAKLCTKEDIILYLCLCYLNNIRTTCALTGIKTRWLSPLPQATILSTQQTTFLFKSIIFAAKSRPPAMSEGIMFAAHKTQTTPVFVANFPETAVKLLRSGKHWAFWARQWHAMTHPAKPKQLEVLRTSGWTGHRFQVEMPGENTTCPAKCLRFLG